MTRVLTPFYRVTYCDADDDNHMWEGGLLTWPMVLGVVRYARAAQHLYRIVSVREV